MPSTNTNPARARPLAWTATPEHVLAAWPADRPVAAILSAQRRSRWSRWSILAQPVEELPFDMADPLASLDDAIAATRDKNNTQQTMNHSDGDLPFTGGWIGWLSYDLGRIIEPAAQAPPGDRPRDDRAWPLMSMLRCPGAYVYDHLNRRWWAVGQAKALPDLEDMLSASFTPELKASSFTVRDLTIQTDRSAYEGAVAQVISLIGAGDIFQANITHRISGRFTGSARALCRSLTKGVGPWFGSCIESLTPGRAVVSLSPELFLSIDPRTRRVVTRPMKGTRPADAPLDELASSEKDKAELVMIVDLMRNDLGRVCRFGSIKVTDERAIERHGGVNALASSGVQHSVATIEGELRDDVTIGDLLRATFPGGSITGAPKIRAMQIIDELETVRRGPYCGAVGFISDSGAACFNIAIRTACVSSTSAATDFHHLHGRLDYAVGAGIVADSEPGAEWEETLAKAAGFRHALQESQSAGAMMERADHQRSAHAMLPVESIKA